MTPRDEIKNIMNFLVTLKPEDLARESELGTNFSLREIVPTVERIRNEVCIFSDEYLDNITNEQLNNISNYLKSFWGYIDEAIKFNPAAVTNPIDIKNNIINNIRNCGNDLLNSLQTNFIGAHLLKMQRDQTNGQIHELKIEFEKLKSFSDGIVKDAQKAKKEYDLQQAKYKEEMEYMQKFAEKALPQKESQLFLNQANRYKDSARIWAIFTVFSLLLIVAFAVSLFLACAYRYFPIDYTNTWEVLNLLSNKAIILFALIYFTYICAKSYFANRHNEAVNKHRHNVFESYGALITSSAIDAHKEIILSNAMTTIFSAQETGFIKAHQDLHPQGTLMDILPMLSANKIKS